MDKMAGNYADILGNSNTMERHFGRRGEQESGKFSDWGLKMTGRAATSKTRERGLRNWRNSRRRFRSGKEISARQGTEPHSQAYRAPVHNGRADDTPVTGYPGKLLKTGGRRGVTGVQNAVYASTDGLRLDRHRKGLRRCEKTETISRQGAKPRRPRSRVPVCSLRPSQLCALARTCLSTSEDFTAASEACPNPANLRI